MRVYQLKNNGQIYGAVQSGTHQFYIKEPAKAPYLTSRGKFTHLWMFEEGQWKLKRVLSYDHEVPKKSDTG